MGDTGNKFIVIGKQVSRGCDQSNTLIPLSVLGIEELVNTEKKKYPEN